MSDNGCMSQEDLTEKIQKIGWSVYDKIHFGVPFRQPHPNKDQYTYLDDYLQAVRPFAMARIGFLLYFDVMSPLPQT